MVALNTGLGLAAEGPCGLIGRVQNQGAVTTGMPLPKPSHGTTMETLGKIRSPNEPHAATPKYRTAESLKSPEIRSNPKPQTLPGSKDS